MLSGKWPRDAAALAFLALLAVGMLVPAMLAHATLGQYPSDGTRALYFAREYLLDSIRDARLPLWNPFIQFGTPFLADIQWGALYPLNILVAVLSVDLAYNLFIALHLALAGVFSYLLARDWGLDPVPALVTGLSFMLSGRSVTTAWAGNVNMLSAIAWLPAVVLLFDRAIRAETRRGLWIGLAATVFGVQVVSGHPQFTFFTGCVLVALAIRRVRTVAMLILVVVLAAGIAAAQLAPTYEATALSTRTFEWTLVTPPLAIEGSYNPIRIATWLVPDLFGNPASLRPAATDWLSLLLHEAHSNEFAGYVGVLPLLLAAFSVTSWRTESRVRFLWGVAAGSFVLALGQFALVYGVLYAALPPLRTFRVPARFLTLAVFAFSLLAGFGAQALWRADRVNVRRWAKAILALGSLLAVGGVLAFALRTPIVTMGQEMAAPLFAGRPAGALLAADGQASLIAAAYALTLRGTVTAAVILAAAAAVFRLAAAQSAERRWLGVAMLAVVAGDLTLHASSYTTSESMTTQLSRNSPIVNALRADGGLARVYSLESGRVPDLIRPNDSALIHERLFTAGGYESFELSAYRSVRNALDDDLRRGSDRVASLFGIRYVVSDVPLSPSLFRELARAHAATLYEVPAAVSRAYVVGRARRVAGTAEALDLIRSGRVEPGEEVLVESRESILEGSKGSAGRAVIDSLAPELVRLTVDADRDGYLVLNDTQYPGWSATVDGVPTPIFRANGLVRGVAVSRGSHAVVMRFSSRTFAIGGWVSLAFIACTALVAATALRGGR